MKRIALKCFYVTVAFVVIFNTVFTIKDAFFFDIDDLPKGSFLFSETSPDNRYLLSAYRVDNALGEAIRIEVSRNDSSSDKRNIFWQVGIDNAALSWKTDNIVAINNMPINIADGSSYDCRSGMAILREGSFETIAQ